MTQKLKNFMTQKLRFPSLLFMAVVLVNSCKLESSSHFGNKNIQMSSIAIDSVIVGKMENTSYYGQSGQCGDSLYFYDKALSYLYYIGIDGTVGSRRLGLGHSSQELPAKDLDVCYNSREEQLVGIGSSLDVYVYDKPKDKVRKLSLKYVEGKGNYESPYSYSTWDEFIMYSAGDYAYYNILGEAEGVRITEEADYFKKAAILMKLNMKAGEQSPIGRYSDFYSQNKNKVRHLPHIYFDVIDDGSLCVTFQADPQIYHYSKDFELLETFGFNGTDMNTDYSECELGTEGFGKAYMQDIDRVGYYYWLKCANGYTFRSYRTSGDALNDRMQVYDSDYNLIADVEVPKDFRVVGYIAPYFITSIKSSEDENQLMFYKFKLT